MNQGEQVIVTVRDFRDGGRLIHKGVPATVIGQPFTLPRARHITVQMVRDANGNEFPVVVREMRRAPQPRQVHIRKGQQQAPQEAEPQASPYGNVRKDGRGRLYAEGVPEVLNHEWGSLVKEQKVLTVPAIPVDEGGVAKTSPGNSMQAFSRDVEVGQIDFQGGHNVLKVNQGDYDPPPGVVDEKGFARDVSKVMEVKLTRKLRKDRGMGGNEWGFGGQ